MPALRLTSFLALLQITTAESTLTRRALIGNGFGDSLYSISDEHWNEALNDPDATGRYPIDGYDVSKPYPEEGILPPIEGWSIDVNITADIPIPTIPDRFISGVNIRVSPPTELISTDSNGTTTLKADMDEWKVCISYLALSSEALEKAKSDDGSCSSIVSQECIQDLTNTDNNLDRSTGRCRSPETGTPNCEGLFNGGATNSTIAP